MDTRQKSENVFKEFLELVHKLTNDDKEIHRTLQKSYDRTNPHFRWSRGFINLVTLCGDKIRVAPEKCKLHIQEFVKELSNYKAKPLKHLLADASQISDSDDSSLEDAPPAKKPNIETGKAYSVGEVGSLTNQHKSFSNGRKGDEMQAVVNVGGPACRSEKRKHSNGSEEIAKFSEGNDDSNNSEFQRKKRWFYNSATALKSSDSSLPLIGYVKNIHAVSQSTKTKINSSDIICLDDDDDSDETCEKNQKDDDCVEGGVEGEAKRTTSTKSGSKPACLDNINISKSRTDSNPKNSSLSTDKVPPNEIEVICLDDDDDEVEAPEKGGQKIRDSSKCAEFLLKYRFPVKKLIEASLLPTKAIADLGVIEIIDTDEKQHEDKTLEVKDIPPKRLATGNESNTVESEDESANANVFQRTELSGVTGSKSVEDGNEAVESGDEIIRSKCETFAVGEFGNTGDGNKDEASSGDEDYDDVAEDKEAEDEEILKQANHLSRVLRKLGKEIQRLELTEMTLNDMNSEESAFVKESELRSKFIETWTQMCEITSTKFTRRACDRRFVMEIPDYPEMGRKISEFINEGKVFPDFQDIYEIVESCNSSCNLLLTESAIQNVSEKIFKSVGNKIQQQRKLVLSERMNSYLPANIRSYDDPAMFDKDLCQKLEDSRSVGNEKLQSIFVAFSEKQDVEGDEVIVSDEDEDDSFEDSEEEEEGDDKDEDMGKSVDEANILQSDSHVELSSVSELPISCIKNVSMESSRQDVETVDDSFSEDDDDDKESIKTSNSDADDDVLVIRFDDGFKSNEGSGCETAVTSDSLTANESSVASQQQDSVNRNKMPDSSQFKIQSDLLQNIRRLTSNITFPPSNDILEAADNKDSANRADHISTLERSSQKILEVEIVDDDESAKSNLPLTETSPKQAIFTVRDADQEDRENLCADTVSNTKKANSIENISNIYQVEQKSLEPVSPKESDTTCHISSDESANIANAVKVTTEVLETASNSKLEVKTLPIISDKVDLTTVSCDEMQLELDGLPESSTDEALIRESPVQVADEDVQPTADLASAAASSNPAPVLDVATSLLATSTSNAVNDGPIDVHSSSSDLELQLESSSENAEPSTVSCDHRSLDIVDVPDDICLLSDVEFPLESSFENAETVEVPCNPSSDKCKELVANDATNAEKTSSLLEKLREVCANEQCVDALGSKQKDTEKSVVIIDGETCEQLAMKELLSETAAGTS